MIIKFGIWELHNHYGIIGKVGPTYDYQIHKERLWQTQEYKGKIVWEWLIHLTEKDWITLENVNDFNIAFLFGQEIFKEFKPKEVPNVSFAQSVYIQRQLIEIGVKFNEKESDSVTNNMNEYWEALNNIKLLQ